MSPETSLVILESRTPEAVANELLRPETSLVILESREPEAVDISAERFPLRLPSVFTKLEAKFSLSPSAAANSLRVSSAAGARSMTPLMRLSI